MALAEKLKDFMGYTDDYYDDAPADEADQQESAAGESREYLPYQAVIFKPERFDEASAIADQINAGRIVVINLESATKEAARRLIDFLSGAAYARSGRMERVSSCTYLVTPCNVEYVDERDDSFENARHFF